MCAVGVVGIIRDRLDHWCAPLCSSGSSGVAGFIGVRRGDLRVHPGSLRYVLGVVGFIGGRWGHWRARWHCSAQWRSSGSSGAVGFIDGAPWGSPGSSGVVGFIDGAPWVSPGPSLVDGFIGARPGGRRVHQGVAWFVVVCPGCRHVYPRSFE